MGRTGNVVLPDGSRWGIDIDAPALTARKMCKRPLDRLTPNGELPAKLAAQPVQEGRRRAEDVEPTATTECIRQALRFLARLELRGGVAAAGERAYAESRIGWKVQVTTHPDLLSGESQIVVRGR